MKVRTGTGDALSPRSRTDSGTQMLTNRQSSLPVPSGCVQGEPYSVAFNESPCQQPAEVGGDHLAAPVGDSAYRIPRNDATRVPPESVSHSPYNVPHSVLTKGWSAAWAKAGASSRNIMRRAEEPGALAIRFLAPGKPSDTGKATKTRLF